MRRLVIRPRISFVQGALLVLALVCGQTSAQTFTTLFHFDSTHGSYPYGDLTLSPDGSTLYGMARQGGTYGYGTIFSEPVGGGTPTVLFNFDGTHGGNPYGSLILSGSTLYGMTAQGGTNGYGTIFSLTIPEPSTFALLGVGIATLLLYAWRRRKR